MIDYNSKDGFMTTVWGPPMWFVLHTIAANYPPRPTAKQKRDYRAFVMSLQNVLPCGACRENLKRNLQDVPLTDCALKSRYTFSRWMYRLHDHVNKMLCKGPSPSFQDVRDGLENFRATCAAKEYKHGESGCTEPAYKLRKKPKCVLHILPFSEPTSGIHVDRACLRKRT